MAMKNADARNRALRTLVQGLVFDVLAAAGLVLFTAFSSAERWSDIDWRLLGFLVTKSVVVSGLSYLMRTVFDRQTDVLEPPRS